MLSKIELIPGHKSKTKYNSKVTIVSIRENVVYYSVEGLSSGASISKKRFIEWLKETNQWNGEE